MSNREYLGDSVYVDNDGFMVRLYTDNGNGPRSEIFLEPSVMIGLLRYWNQMQLQKRDIIEQKAIEEKALSAQRHPCRP